VSWQFAAQTATHRLPLGVTERVPAGARVAAGDVIASGTTYGSPVRLAGARRLGVTPDDLGRVLRVAPGAEIERGAIIARTGRRFTRAVTAPMDGRIAHVRADGDLELAPVVDRWTVRATLDGVVTASTESVVTIEGTAWALQGVAAYGRDAVGELALAVGGPNEELQPSRIDTRLRDRILIGGGRSGAEAITRAHACGVAAVVAGAVPAAGLRVVFGEEASAQSTPLRGDVPTVLCLVGFGSAQLPPAIFEPLASLAGARAAVHTASARLFVFAGPSAIEATRSSPSIALLADWGAVRPLDGPAAQAEEVTFPSEVVAPAVRITEGAVPVANVRAFDSPRS
jgi:hypothetical protein